MNLLLDIGNSRIKWACNQQGRWLAENIALRTGEAADWDFLKTLPAEPRRILAVCVAGPEIAEQCVAASRQLWSLEVEFAIALEQQRGLRNGYRDPEQLGADRWLAMLAARRDSAEALCVVDAGTAITVDLVEADGLHRGGFILPGLGLMAAALDFGTGEIRSRAERSSAEPGNNSLGPAADTRGAINNAALLAAAGLIDRARQMTASTANLVVTGGDAPALQPLLPAGCLLRPRLVLEGLIEAFRPDGDELAHQDA